MPISRRGNAVSREAPTATLSVIPMTWIEAPIRDSLRTAYADQKSDETSNAKLLAAYHWMVWQNALAGDHNRLETYHRILVKNVISAGQSCEIIEHLHGVVLSEAIDLILRRYKYSMFLAKQNIMSFISANHAVVTSFAGLSKPDRQNH